MKSLTHIVKENGQIQDGEKLFNWFKRLLVQLPDGDLVIEIRPTDITAAQRKYYYSQVGQMANFLGVDRNTLHKRFKAAFFPEELLEFGLTSIKDLDKEQMSYYIDECVRNSAEFFNYKWADPIEYKHQ